MTPWIKLETTTPDKPEVSIIAEKTRLDPDAVVGKLLRLWCWADTNSIDGNAVRVTEEFLDRMARKKGFAAGMRAAGWLAGESGNLTFPGFSRHNGTTAKSRAAGGSRVEKHRSRNGAGVTNTESCNGSGVTIPLPDIDIDIEKNPTDSPPLSPLAGMAETIVSAYPRREKIAEGVREVLRQLRASKAPAHEAEKMLAGTKAYAQAILALPSGALNTFVPSCLRFFAEKRYLDDPATLSRRGHRDGGTTAAAPPDTHGRQPFQTINLCPEEP